MELEAAAVKAENEMEAGAVKIDPENKGEEKDLTAVAAAVRDEPNLRWANHVFSIIVGLYLFSALVVKQQSVVCPKGGSFTFFRWGPVSNQEVTERASFGTSEQTDTRNEEELANIMDDLDKPEEETEESVTSGALQGIQAG